MVVGCLGAGNYASRVLIPHLRETGAKLEVLVTSGGVNSVYHGSKYGFVDASTDPVSALNNSKVNTIIIATQHISMRNKLFNPWKRESMYLLKNHWL